MAFVKYIIHKRFRAITLCGKVNLPYGTELEAQGRFVLYGDNPMCCVTSQNAYDHMARNDDGMGLERGKLTTNIIKTLGTRDDNYQIRWDKVWEDELCQKYKRIEHSDYWLWNFDFFNAEIDDLRYIDNLIKL